jgi:molecular chaperone Hsp33
MQLPEDHLIQATTADSTIRLLAAVTTTLTDEACQRHKSTPVVSAALGRALAGALLLGRTLKDLERLTLRFDCRGSIGGITAEASAHGTVRGYVKNPLADAPLNAAGKLDVKAIVGGGMLNVIREIGGDIGLNPEPYYGTVPIVSGEIAEDLAHYLLHSEQIQSALSLGVFIEGEQDRVAASGGYLIQVMPGASEETLAAIEKAVMQAPHPTEMIKRGVDAEGMLQLVLGEMPFETLHRMPVEFRCNCSYDRAIHLVSCLERAEVEEMLAQDKGAEMTCHFCSAVYLISEAALHGILYPTEMVM